MARRALKTPVLFGFALASILATSSALADEDTPAASWETAPAEHRSGFTAGLSLGLGVGSVAGYPNDAQKIGYERYYTETGVAPGGGMRLWLGGALTDWFTFGLGFGGGSLASDTTSSGGGGFFFRLEAYPLYPYGSAYRDLGVSFEAGTGGLTTTPKDDADTKLIDAGSASMLGIGAFYEGIRVWRMGMGPFASFDYAWSETAKAPAFMLGWRTAVYAGP